MNINFKYLKDVATTLHAMHREDKKAYWEGRHVYSVEFEPEHGTVKVHVQWPTFRNLQKRFPNSPVEHVSHDTMSLGAWINLTAEFDGIKFHAVLDRKDLLKEFKYRQVQVNPNASIEALYAVYRRLDAVHSV